MNRTPQQIEDAKKEIARAFFNCAVLNRPTTYWRSALDKFCETYIATQPCPKCVHCDGTGDVHSADGEYRGKCNCGHELQAKLTMAEAVIEKANAALNSCVFTEYKDIDHYDAIKYEFDEQLTAASLAAITEYRDGK